MEEAVSLQGPEDTKKGVVNLNCFLNLNNSLKKKKEEVKLTPVAPEIPKASKNLCGQETVHKRAQQSCSALPTNPYLTIENLQGRQACKVRRLLCMFPETAVSGRGLFSREGSCRACAALGAPAQSWFLYFSGWAQKAMGPQTHLHHPDTFKEERCHIH